MDDILDPTGMYWIHLFVAQSTQQLTQTRNETSSLTAINNKKKEQRWYKHQIQSTKTHTQKQEARKKADLTMDTYTNIFIKRICIGLIKSTAARAATADTLDPTGNY